MRSRGIEKLIGIGADISSSADKFDGEKFFFPDTKSFMNSTVFDSFRNEVILIKGSRNFHFEEISEQLG